MPKFQKKPDAIDAVQYGPDLLPADLFALLGTLDCVDAGVDYILIQAPNVTRYSVIRAGVGDWIVRHPNGLLSVCAADLFSATYEPAEEGKTPCR